MSTRLLFVTLCYFFLNLNLYAQYINITKFDVQKYPELNLEYTVFGANGKVIEDVLQSDIQIFEKGKLLSIESNSCGGSPQKVDSISVTMTFDLSSSMVANSGQNLNIVTKAAKEFLKGISNSYFETAITSFNHQSFLNTDFTSEYKKLVSIIDNFKPNGGTNYQNAFLDPNSGAINIAKNGRFSRAIIFITDGLPNNIPDYNQIIQLAQNNNIKIYCITLGFDAPQYLKEISLRTGGKCYEGIGSINSCILTYLDILKNIENVGPCNFVLNLEKNCEIDRTLFIKIPKYGISDSINFKVPLNRLPQIEFSPNNTLEFGNLIPPTKTTKFVSIKAINSDISITNIKTNNNKFTVTNFDGPPPPFVLYQNESRNIEIEFDVKDSALASAKIEIESDACINDPIYCSGGFKFIAPDEASNPNKLRVVFPNGGETFLAKSDTVLRWDGVTPKDTVTLEYSLDAGESWNLITNQGTGLSHKFTMPDTSSNTCLLRVRQIAAVDTTKKDTIINLGYGELASMDLSPDATKLAAGNLFGQILIIDVATGNILKELNTNNRNSNINNVKWSPDGSKLMYGNIDAYILETTNWTALDVIGDLHTIKSFSWSPNGQNFALIKDNTNLIYVGNINGLVITDTLKEHTGPVNSIEWNPTGTKLISSSRDANVIVWDYATKQPENVFVYIPSIGGSDYITNYANWSPDGKYIAYGFGRIYLADGNNYSLIDSIVNTAVTGIKWNKTSDSIIIRNINNELFLYKIENSKFKNLYNITNSVYADWLPSKNSIIASTNIENYFKIFDLAIKDTTANYKIFNRTISRIDWSRDGKKIALGDVIGDVRVFEVPQILTETGFKFTNFFANSEFTNRAHTTSLKFSPDNSSLLVARDFNDLIEVYNLSSNLVTTSIKLIETADKYDIVWSNNNKYIATNKGRGGLDIVNDGFEIYDAKSGNSIYSLKADNWNYFYKFPKISWSPDDSYVLFDNAIDTMYRYNMSTGLINTYNYNIKKDYNISTPKSFKNRKDTIWYNSKIGSKFYSRLLDLNTNKVIKSLSCAAEYFTDDELIGFSPPNGGFQDVNNNNYYLMQIWDLENSDQLKEIFIPTISSNLAIKPKSHIFATAVFGGRVSIWNLQFPRSLKTDISDTLWRIIRPKAESFDVDMGIVAINTFKDSVVSYHLRNISEANVTITDIKITGTDAADFELVSGLNKKPILPTTAQDIEYRFKPTTLGKKSANIVITTTNQVITQNIIGESIDFSLELTVKDIDFGSILVNTTKDSIIFLLNNKNNFPVDITNTNLVGSNSDKFRINSGGGAFTLAANSSRQLNLTFLPRNVGKVSANIEFYFNGANSPLVANLYGTGFGLDAFATIQPEDKEAFVGDTIEVPIYLTELIDVDKSGASGITSILKFNSTILYPLDSEKGTVLDGVRSIPLDLSVQPDIDNKVKTMKFVTLLGNDSLTDLRIENSNSYGGRIFIKELPGKVLLKGLCREGGVRLINISDPVELITPIPNPANEDFNLNFSTIEKGYTNISLYNLLGQKVLEIVNSEVSTGNHSVNCNLNSVGSGSYMLIMNTATERRSIRFEVIKR